MLHRYIKHIVIIYSNYFKSTFVSFRSRIAFFNMKFAVFR